MGMAPLTIIWHSRTGAAKQLAFAAAAAASQHHATELIEAQNASPVTLINAGSLLFVAPENLGSLSGLMKEFFDRCYYPCLDKLNGKSYSAVIAAGSAGHGALAQLRTICTGWRLKEVAPAQIVHINAQSPEAIQAEKRLSDAQLAIAADVGALLAARLAAGLD
jgi:NAD(P)H-dependent FMN reductase